MIVELTSAYNGLKTAYDIAKGLNAANTQAQINEVKIALQQHILDAREALDTARETQAAAGSRIAELEREILRLKDWSAEKQRYQLQNVWRGAIVYALRPEVGSSEPPHWLCANCFTQGYKSFLQHKGQDKSGPEATYGCDTCKGSIKVSFRTSPASAVRNAEAAA